MIDILVLIGVVSTGLCPILLAIFRDNLLLVNIFGYLGMVGRIRDFISIFKNSI